MKFVQLNDDDSSRVNVSNAHIAAIYAVDDDEIKIDYSGEGNQQSFYYNDEEQRDHDLKQLVEHFESYKPSLTQHKEQGVLHSLREYFQKHREVFFTVAIVMLADHFIFGGVFRKKLEDIIHSLIDKAKLQLEASNKKTASK